MPFSDLVSRQGLAWVGLNILRFVTIAALVVAAVGQVLVLAADIQHFSTAPTNLTDSSILAAANATTGHVKAAANSTAPAAAAGSTTVEGLVAGTDVPTSPGGIMFYSLSAVFTLMMLVLLMISELPLPAAVADFIARSSSLIGLPFLRGDTECPSCSASGGRTLIFPALLEMGIASQMLSHELERAGKTVGDVAVVGGWMLFIVGGVNLLFPGLLAAAMRKSARKARGRTFFEQVERHPRDVEKGAGY